MPWRPSEMTAPRRAIAPVPAVWRRCRRQTLRDAVFVAMMTTSWLAGNLLAVLGCLVVSVIVISHGDFTVFMSHLDNIASRYVSAGADRRASFEHEVIVTLAVVSVVLFVIRLPRFVMRLRVELSQEIRDAS